MCKKFLLLSGFLFLFFGCGRKLPEESKLNDFHSIDKADSRVVKVQSPKKDIFQFFVCPNSSEILDSCTPLANGESFTKSSLRTRIKELLRQEESVKKERKKRFQEASFLAAATVAFSIIPGLQSFSVIGATTYVLSAGLWYKLDERLIDLDLASLNTEDLKYLKENVRVSNIDDLVNSINLLSSGQSI